MSQPSSSDYKQSVTGRDALPGGRPLQGRSQRNSVATGIVVIFYVFLTIEYIRPQDVFPIIGVVRPALICVVILGFFSLTRLNADVFKDRSIRLTIAFVALCWFGVIHAVNTYHAFNTSLSMTAFLVGAAIPTCLIVRSEAQLRSLVIFWVAAHGYLAVYGLLHGGRGPGSFLADENDLALALNAALPYALIVRKDPRLSKFKRLAFLLVAVVITAGVVATSSRGGFVGLVVTTAGLVWFSKERVRIALLIVLGAVCFYFAVPEEYKSEVRSISDAEDKTRQGRLYQWGIGWDMFVDNPIVGVGTANYPWRVVEYELQSEDYVPGRMRLHGGRVAHSLYFTLIPEHGVVGITIFFLLLWEVLKKLKKNVSRARRDIDDEQETLAELFSRATLVSLLAFLTTGIFISVLYYPTFWHIVGFAFCASIIRRKELGSDKTEHAS